MKKQVCLAISISLIILSFTVALPVRGTNYAPGVTKGQYVTLGHITYTANGPIPLGQLNGTSSLTNTVTDVTGKNVTAQQYWTFNNGTLPRTNTVQGDVETGKGNLTLFIIAGGLTAGDPVNQLSQGQIVFGVINQTVTRTYAGATRSVNVQNYTRTFQQYFIKGAIYNDAATGFLLEFSESGHLPNSPTSSVTFSFDAVATSTNVWPPSGSADFSVDASPASSTNILPGSSVNFHLNLSSLQGFSGTVMIVAGLTAANSTIPNHVTVSPASSSVNVPLSKSGTETLSASSTSSTPVGLYILTVNATSGALFHSDHLTVRVVSPNPDFTIAANPVVLNIPQGSSQNSTITLTSLNGLSGSVSIITSYDYTNLVVAPSYTSVVLASGGTAAFQLKITAKSTAPVGPYSVTLTGYFGVTTFHSVTIHTNVTTATVGDFSISANPISLIIPQGHAKYTNTTVTGFNGFAGSIAITYANHVPGALIMGPVGVTLGTNGSDTFPVQIYVPTSTPPGTYYLNVTGTASSIHTVKIPVQVVQSSQPGFNITITPSSQSVAQGQSGTAIVTLRSLNGFHGTVTLWSLFSSLQPSFSPSTVTLLSGQKVNSTMTIAPTASTAIGVYQVDVEGQTNSTGAYDATTTAVTVTPGTQQSFTLTPTQNSLSFALGGAGNDNLAIDAQNGFTGTVTFATTVTSGGLPSTGLTAYCSSETLDTTVTHKTSTCLFYSLAPGTYSVDVQGSGGTPSVSSHATYVVTVTKASPSISASLSSGGAGYTGQSVTESATLTGGYLPTGTVTYEYFTGSACSGSSTIIGSPVTVYLGLVPSSAPLIFTHAGTFSFNAVYNGDGNNNAATSPCQQLTVNVPFDYSLTSSKTTATITPGQTFTATITATLTTGVALPVALQGAISPIPTACQPSYGVSPCGTITLSPTSITPTLTGATSTLTVATTTTVPPGTYTLTITGSPAGTSSASATITLTVTAAPTPDLTINANTNPVSATTDSPATSTITVSAVHGFTGTVTLTISAPSGITCTLDHTTLQGYGTATLTCTSSTPKDYTVTIIATGGPTQHSTTQTFHVAAAPSPAAPAPSTPWLIYIIIIIVVIAVAGGLVVVTRRKNP